MANLTYSVYIHTKTISLDKTFLYNVLNKGGETEKKNINLFDSFSGGSCFLKGKMTNGKITGLGGSTDLQKG